MPDKQHSISDFRSPHLYLTEDELVRQRDPFHQSPIFEQDRRRLASDLDVLYAGELAPSLFSWWCVNLPDAVVAGQYQASLETLLVARLLSGDARAPVRAREILLDQAALPGWQERNYGLEMGYDLASSHHARAFAAGIGAARAVLSAADIDMLFASYLVRVRRPYVAACYGGNAYLVGLRNTNWLAHLSGSVLLAELALAKFERADRCCLALAKANLLRYIDSFHPDGSLPENGDYLFYGLEFALLALHAWSVHFGREIIDAIAQPGLRRALSWPLAFTNADGVFWGDFGDTHMGRHDASRVTGYLAARHFRDGGGQWLGDLGGTREPLAPLLRDPAVAPARELPRICLFPGEQTVAINLSGRHLALRGGACRSPDNQIPHRHYDAGSIIFRDNGINVVADTGFDRYTDTFWLDYDSPTHECSAAPLHNVVLVDGRGFQNVDGVSGRIMLCAEDMPGCVHLVWQLAGSFPGLELWERQIVMLEQGPMAVVDRVRIEPGARLLSIPWHLHARPSLLDATGWKTEAATGRTMGDVPLALVMVADQPRPCVRIDATPGAAGRATIVTLFAPYAAAIEDVRVDWTRHALIGRGWLWDMVRRCIAPT